MARQPKYPYREAPRRRTREAREVVRPEGRFIREQKPHVHTDRSPVDVTGVNPDDMAPILPESPYIPPQ